MTLDQIQLQIESLALVIDAPKNIFPEYGYSGESYISSDGYGNMSYVIAERGTEYQRKTTKDIYELLFWIFEDVTFSMACDFEVNHRIENQDFRVVLFDKQIELLHKLNKDWAEVVCRKNKRLLTPSEETKRHRKEYSKQLEDEGVETWEAWLKACEKYPSG